MFFILSKIFWFFARPLNALLLAALVGGLLKRVGWQRTGTVMLVAASIGIATIGLTQLPDLLLYELETRVTQREMPPDPAGIIVLGGGISAESASDYGGYYMGEASDRIIKGLELRRHYPAARFIYTGGLATLAGQGLPEASGAMRLIEALYGSTNGFEFETQARNTWENAVLVKEMAGADDGRPWLLVTSAFHMPRALGCFRQAGMNVIPVPADYRADVFHFPWLTGDMANQFLKMNVMVKELIGLVAYRLTGRTDALLPR